MCVCTRSCLCFNSATAGMWLSCAWMWVFVHFSVSVPTATMLTCVQNENTVIKETLLARLLFFFSFFLGSYLHYAARCQNERFTYQCQENAVRVSVNVWLTNSLIWLWHTNPVGTVLPEGTPVTPCSDSHFTSQPRPLSWGLPGTYTTKPCPGPPSLVLGAQIP